MFRCLACGCPTLSEPPGGTFDICGNCGWEDDNVQASDHSFAGGANAPNMEDHRKAHLEALAIQAFRDARGVHGRPHIEVRIPLARHRSRRGRSLVRESSRQRLVRPIPRARPERRRCIDLDEVLGNR